MREQKDDKSQLELSQCHITDAYNILFYNEFLTKHCWHCNIVVFVTLQYCNMMSYSITK